MWTRTRLTELLGLDYPIVQGPFGGGYSTVALAAAVSAAGGLGSFGALGLSSDGIRQTAREIAARTARPFALNIWVPIAGQDDRAVTAAERTRSAAHLARHYQAMGLALPDEAPAPDPYRIFAEQAEAVLEARPPVWSFVMGAPDRALLSEARARGIRTIGTASTVEEGVALADAGADAVVASGSDAGGHRGAFLRPVESSLVGTMSLVPQLAAAVGVPVIAAGGIADGRGIAAALALGAEGVQIGTAFLASAESGAPPAHKQLLGRADVRATRLTRVFSGRLARGIENELLRDLEQHPEDVLPYPAQNALTSPLRRAAAQAGRADLLALWAGQSAALARPGIDAGELLRLLVEETDQVLRQPRLDPRPG